MMIKKAMQVAVMLVCSQVAMAATYDWNVKSTVSFVEPTYLPVKVRILLDENTTGVCANKFLDYHGQGAEPNDNAMAVYSALMTALISGNRVDVYATNDCVIKYVHLLRQ